MQYIYIVLFLPLAPPLLSSPPAPQNYHLNLKKKIKINNTKGSKLKRKLKQLKLVHATAAAH